MFEGEDGTFSASVRRKDQSVFGRYLIPKKTWDNKTLDATNE